MKACISTSVVFWISAAGFLITGCGINRAESLRMLDRRAEYDLPPGEPVPPLREGGLEGFRNAPVPVRTRAQVAAVWIFPHETATHDYFWGGWVSLVTEDSQWVLTRPGALPAALAVSDAGKAKSRRKPKHTKAHVENPAPATGSSPASGGVGAPAALEGGT